MYSAQNVTGRLVEITITPPFTLAQTAGFVSAIKAAVMEAVARPSNATGKVVVCVDARRLQVMDPSSTDGIVVFMRSDNPRLERGAYVVGERATIFALQMGHMLRESNNPSRRVCKDAREAIAWLNDILTGPERDRLKEFLGA